MIYLGGVLLLVFGLYPLYFYGVLGFSLSEDPKDWGKFGAYAGGVLGPILSFYSIYLLLDNIKRDREVRREDLEKERLLLQMELARKPFDDLSVKLVEKVKEPLFPGSEEYHEGYSLESMIEFHRDNGFSSPVYISGKHADLFELAIYKIYPLISILLQVNKEMAECSTRLGVVRFKDSNVTVDDIIFMGAAIKICFSRDDSNKNEYFYLYSYLRSKKEYRWLFSYMVRGQKRKILEIIENTHRDGVACWSKNQ